MSSTTSTRRLQGHMAAAIRDFGADSPQARDARRRWNTARLIAVIQQAHAEHGPFSAEQKMQLTAALDKTK